MKCPKCQQNTPDSWKPFWPDWSLHRSDPAVINSERVLRGKSEVHLNEENWLALDYMSCANEECYQYVIRLHHTHWTPPTFTETGLPAGPGKSETLTWIVFPPYATRPLDALVEEPYRRDYLEASAILEISPRASAMLARRLIEHLLEDFDGATGNSLAGKIDRFIENTGHPSNLKGFLNDVREMVDTTVHPKRDMRTGDLIDLTHDEADWTLDVVDRLLDYFIIGPERTKQIQAVMDKKMGATGRKAIKRGPSGNIKP